MDYSIEMSTVCPLATEIYSSLAFHIVQWCILSSCFSSVLVVIYSFVCFHYRHPFENSTKELISVLYLYVTIYSSSQVFNQGTLLFYRYSASSPCEAQVPRGFCISRMLGSSIVPSFVVIHIAITVQRTLSTFSAVILNIVVMFALDVLNVIASFALWRYNKHKLESRSSYGLEDTYRHRQNALTAFNFLPIEVIHTIVYCSLFVVYVLGASLKRQHTDGEYLFINVVSNIFPYYVLACPLILTILIRKDRSNRKNDVKGMITQSRHTNKYFEELAKQWNPEETPRGMTKSL